MQDWAHGRTSAATSIAYAVVAVASVGVLAASPHPVKFLVLAVLLFISEVLTPFENSRWRSLTPAFAAGLSFIGGPLAAISLVGLASVAGRLIRRQQSDLVAGVFTILTCATSAGLVSLVAVAVWDSPPAFAVGYVAGWGLAPLLIRRRSEGFPVMGVLGIVAIAFAVCQLSSDRPILLALFLLPAIGLWRLNSMDKREKAHRKEMVDALLQILERAHPPTHSHALRTEKLVAGVAARLGLKPGRVEMLRHAVALHDIGKVAVDDRILDKPGPLEQAEYQHVKEHSKIGAEIISRAPCLSPIGDWILFHHERMDGCGYPRGMCAANAPLESRIIAVVDAYDAMTAADQCGRGYRSPKSRQEAIDELLACSGTQFDPQVIYAFCEVLKEEGQA